MKLSLPVRSLLCGAWLFVPSVQSIIDCASITCQPESNFGSGTGFATYKYGDSVVASDGYENQVGDLYLPSTAVATPIPVVVVIHGGYWYDDYRRKTNNGSDMRPLSLDLQNRGFAVVNLEYRRAGSYDGKNSGDGGVPGTFNDVSKGVDALSCLAELQTACGFTEALDHMRVATVGHSAGGHLALWRALQAGIPSNTYGIDTSPIVKPIAAVGLAAVSDLYSGCADGTASCDAIANFLDLSTSSFPENKAELEAVAPYTSPTAMLATSTEQLDLYANHGSADEIVLPGQSSDFVAAAKTYGNQFTSQPDPFNTTSGKNHFQMTDPDDSSWERVIPFLESVLIAACSVDPELS